MPHGKSIVLSQRESERTLNLSDYGNGQAQFDIYGDGPSKCSNIDVAAATVLCDWLNEFIDRNQTETITVTGKPADLTRIKEWAKQKDMRIS